MSHSAILGKGQKQKNFFDPNIAPLTKSKLRLPGGQPGQGSYYYSLGVQSTVPFVSLEGGGDSEKIFSWGELIEVEEGQQVTVTNSSFMFGDIEIISGLNYASKPERITVGVPIIGDITVPGTLIRSAFPADTRRCRRAYVAMSLSTDDPILFGIRGLNVKHSLNFSLDGTLIPAPQYIRVITLPGATAIGVLPLGFGDTSNDLLPMSLLDKSEFSFVVPENPPTINYPLFTYILEY